MARSNRSTAQTNGLRGPNWPVPEGHEHARGQDPSQRWPQQPANNAHPGYPSQHGYHPQDPYAPQQHQNSQDYAPYDPYAQPQPQQHDYGRFELPRGGDSFPHTADQNRSFDYGRSNDLGPQRYSEPAPQSWPPQPADPQNWDLAQYAPGQPPAHGGYPPAEFQSFAGPDSLNGYTPQDSRHGGWHDGQGGPYHGEPTFEQALYDQQHGAPGYEGDGQHLQGDPDYDYDEAFEEEEPRRGPRAVVIVGALVGAIALGGGLAYSYKLMGSGGTTAVPAVVKADQSPTKVRPAEPGGKPIEHADKKFLNRLAEDKPASSLATAAISANADNDSGPRKVTTLVVNRDGTLAPHAGPAPAPVPPPSSGVPGMLIEGFAPAARPALRGPQADAPPPPPPVTLNKIEEPSTPAAAPPRVADLPLPKVKADPAPPPPAAKRKPAVREERVASVETDSAPVAAPASPVNGYVAVLSSRKTRQDALKDFADMHQKYAGVLDGHTPDVREANLGEKGLWYRLILGPPGSREAAVGICSKLKAQGYAGCWATAY